MHPDVGFRPAGLVGFDIKKADEDERRNIVNTFSLDLAIRRKRQTQFHTVFWSVIRIAVIARPRPGWRKTWRRIAVLHSLHHREKVDQYRKPYWGIYLFHSRTYEEAIFIFHWLNR